MSRRLKDRLRRMDPEMRDILLRNGISLWVQSGHWLDIADLLTSIDFVQARADDGSIEGLVADYNSALEAWPQDGCGSPGERLAADRRHSSTYTGTGAAVSHATEECARSPHSEEQRRLQASMFAAWTTCSR